MSRAFSQPFWAGGLVLAGLVLAAGLYVAGPALSAANDDNTVAESLSSMLRAARSVVSHHQGLINDPNIADKGITGKSVLAEAMALYKEGTGTDAAAVDPNSRQGRLLRSMMDSIADVVDSHQDTINKKGVGFKGFIPATFARLVNEAFAKRSSTEAEVKVTAPDDLIRNRKARPDVWETEIINKQLLSPSWPRGQVVSAVTNSRGRQAYRFAIPEYYAASCMACHGGPKGEIDLTGYPKEGRNEGDLGGVVSVTLFH